MAGVKETNKEDQKNFKQVFMDENIDYDAILQASLYIKELYKSPDKIFSRLKLESLLYNAQVSVKHKTQEKDVVNYGNDVVQCLGKSVALDLELLSHLNHTLVRLKKEQKGVLEELVGKLCRKLEKGLVFQPDIPLNLPKEAVEVIVLKWLETQSSPHMAVFAKMSANSPKLFQEITSILCETLMRTCHERVLAVTKIFVESVKLECLNEKKDFLRLYPKNCCHLVSLLMVSPEVFSEKQKSIVDEVLSSLFELFWTDRQKAIILLSHYSKWFSDFKMFMQRMTPLG